jgi:hypothetical protein
MASERSETRLPTHCVFELRLGHFGSAGDPLALGLLIELVTGPTASPTVGTEAAPTTR